MTNEPSLYSTHCSRCEAAGKERDALRAALIAAKSFMDDPRFGTYDMDGPGWYDFANRTRELINTAIGEP